LAAVAVAAEGLASSAEAGALQVSPAAANATKGDASGATGKDEPGDAPGRKKKKKKKKGAAPATAATSPSPPDAPPDAPPVGLGFWSGWETPHAAPRPGDAAVAGSSAAGAAPKQWPKLVFASVEAAEAQAAAAAVLASRSGVDEALAAEPLPHAR
jgi:hypothetical protein